MRPLRGLIFTFPYGKARIFEPFKVQVASKVDEREENVSGT